MCMEQCIQKIQIANIIAPVYTDGPGKRVSVYTQGCTLCCPGCQSSHLWDRSGGESLDIAAVADRLLAYELPVTIIGGEPLQQPQAVAGLVRKIKEHGRHIILYTGHTYEELPDFCINNILPFIDVLVDGRYENEQDDPFVQYRGSRNQRPIDMAATRETGKLTLLDWDTPEIIVLENGDIVAAEGLMSDGEFSRMCGETGNNVLKV